MHLVRTGTARAGRRGNPGDATEPHEEAACRPARTCSSPRSGGRSSASWPSPANPACWPPPPRSRTGGAPGGDSTGTPRPRRAPPRRWSARSAPISARSSLPTGRDATGRRTAPAPAGPTISPRQPRVVRRPHPTRNGAGRGPVGRPLQQPQVTGAGDDALPVRGGELVAQRPHVPAHGVPRQGQVAGQPRGGPPGGEPAEDLELPDAQEGSGGAVRLRSAGATPVERCGLPRRGNGGRHAVVQWSGSGEPVDARPAQRGELLRGLVGQ